jgi:geranylgeranyl pyrophosphate synthase
MALALASSAWSELALDDDENRRQVLTHAFLSFITDGIRAAQSEVRYLAGGSFRLAEYLAISTQKAGVYTTHALLIAHALSSSVESLRATLVALGRSTGLLFQLIDDALDASGDTAKTESNTYATFLKRNGEPLTPLYELIAEQLTLSRTLSSSLPHPRQFLELLGELRSLLSLYGWL